jgi:hypothetical protein
LSSKKKHHTENHKKPLGLLLFICVLCLLPFVNKAFHMDDPLFIWVAKQIQTNPFDFYGFSVNWYGSAMPMSEITKNPPFASFYIAIVAFFLGWSEAPLHLAFLIPACLVVAGTYYLAKELCEQPFLATLAAIATPVFLVSSTSVMCDILMLAFWTWAIYFWMRGIKKDCNTDLAIASILIAVCSLTKYFGMSLIPLLIAYSLMEKRKMGQWVLFMLIPVLVLSAYQWATFILYGKGLLIDAASYATAARTNLGDNFFTMILTGLVFTGGCFIPALFYSPLLWKKWVLVIVMLSISFAVFTVYQYTSFLHFTLLRTSNINWIFITQLFLLSCAGLCFIALIATDIRRQHDAGSFLLFLWIMGTLVFAIFINWTINARSILPLAPASGILLVRQLSKQKGPIFQKRFRRLLIPLAPAFAIALLVTWSDYQLANTARHAAAQIHTAYKQTPESLWFQGHWGFQYYMEKTGAIPMDLNKPMLKRRDILAIPLNNTNVENLAPESFYLVQKFLFSTSSFVSTMNRDAGAGFYSDIWGPLPFAIGKDKNEEYYIFRFFK